MAVNKLVVHPAFGRRIRHYRDRIVADGRPQVVAKLAKATTRLIHQLVESPWRGHPARFESPDLAGILRASVPGFSVFAVFYRWDGKTLTILTLEHTAQDLPSRLATVVSNPN
jgi:plasmid stabilization system protein ParE